VMLSCAITIASTIGASVTHNVGQLAACRAINGIALGAKASIGKREALALFAPRILMLRSSYICG
jgi:hypothetical protein